MKRDSRLKRNEDIQRVRQNGNSFAHTAIVLATLPNHIDKNRIAFIAGRFVGGAVQRNFAKRRMRSLLQQFEAELTQGFDLVIIARRPILKIDFNELKSEMKQLLDRAGLMKE